MSTTRADGCHYCPGWASLLWLTGGLLVLLLVGACQQHAPVVPHPAPPAPDAIVAPRHPIASAAPPARASRPRGPAYRVDNGLGSPIARLRQGYGEASSV